MAGLRERIDGAADCPSEVVAVPEWGEGVEVRVVTLSGTEREALELDNVARREAASGDRDWYRGFRLRLLVRAMRDPSDGLPIYRPGEEDALGRRNPFVLDRLFKIADRLNAVTDQALEERAGKSGAAQSGASSTGSPSSTVTATPTSS